MGSQNGAPSSQVQTSTREEMEEDLQSYIAEVARSMGLVLVVDKNQAEVRGIDITNQVLVILQGEA